MRLWAAVQAVAAASGVSGVIAPTAAASCPSEVAAASCDADTAFVPKLAPGGATTSAADAAGSARGLALISFQWQRSPVGDLSHPSLEQGSLGSFLSVGSALHEPSSSVNSGSSTGGDANVSIAAVAIHVNSSDMAEEAMERHEEANNSNVLSNRPGLNASLGTTASPWVFQSRIADASPPRTQMPFEAFGNAGRAMLLELRLPQVTLRLLHGSGYGSLAAFLQLLRGELSKAAAVPEARLSVLGIYGRYQRESRSDISAGLLRMHHANSTPDDQTAPAHLGEEVVVKLEVLPPQAAGEPESQAVADALQAKLHAADSPLTQGQLGATLRNASLQNSGETAIATVTHTNENKNFAHLATMAPIGVSAALIGVLIWIATL